MTAASATDLILLPCQVFRHTIFTGSQLLCVQEARSGIVFSAEVPLLHNMLLGGSGVLRVSFWD